MDYKEKVIALLNSQELSKEQKEKLESIFPELKESEDEKTKRILHSISSKISFHLHDIFTEEEFQCFDAWSNAWLEKQGKNNMGISEATKKKLEDNLNKALEKETPESWNKFLEKQAEQKPAWSEEDEGFLNLLLAIFTNEHPNGVFTTDNITVFKGNCVTSNRIIAWIKSLKDRVQPRQEWSEEDEEHIMAIDLAVNKCLGKWHCCGEKCPISEHNPWLKSLRPQNTWKPSDEQMNTLEYYMHSLVCNKHKEILFGLYADLKKLREE